MSAFHAIPLTPLTVSVVICTYNRCVSLAQTLDSLIAMEVPNDVRLRVLVVDNNSSDQTADVVRRYSDRLPLRYCFEPAQGLSHARNRGIREADGELIIFTDDDIRVDRGWLSAYAVTATRCLGDAYFGGRIEPYWPAGRPRWLRDSRLSLIDGMLGHYDLGDQVRRFAESDSGPWGANMAFRSGIFSVAGLFRTDLGVKGKDCGRGEETEFVCRLRSRGIQGTYVPEAVCYHRIEERCGSLTHAFRYGVQSGVYLARTNNVSDVGWHVYSRAAWICLRGLRQQLLGRGDRFRQCLINAGIRIGVRRETIARQRSRPCVSH